MEDAVKTELLEQFRRYLDGIEELPPPAPTGGSEADLFTLSVDMAALRTEVRTESRLVKDALEQFRAVFQTLQSSQTALEQELQRAHERERVQERALVRPLLLDMLDLRDRLAAGLPPVPVPGPAPRLRWYERWRGKRARRPDPWQDGLRMTLRRLDQLLLERRVTPLELLGQRFDPRLGRVVATRDAAGVGAGLVLEVVRTGFLWDEALLRPAEVVVSKPDAEEQA